LRGVAEALNPRTDANRLWLGQALSLAGSEVSALALPLTAVSVLHGTPSQIGLLTAAMWAPYAVLALPIGVIVDHYDRRPLMIGANLAHALTLALIPMLYLLDKLTAASLIGLTFLAGSFSVVFRLSFGAFLPQAFSGPLLVSLNSRLAATESVAEITGPVTSGVIIRLAGAPVALIADVCSYLVSAWSLRVTAHDEIPPGLTATATEGVFRGLAFIRHDRYLRALVLEAASFNLVWQLTQTALLLLLARKLRLSAVEIGGLFALGSIGGTLGAIASTALAKRSGVGSSTILASLAADLAPAVFVFADSDSALVLVALGAALFVRGVGMSVSGVQTTSLRQLVDPERPSRPGRSSLLLARLRFTSDRSSVWRPTCRRTVAARSTGRWHAARSGDRSLAYLLADTKAAPSRSTQRIGQGRRRRPRGRLIGL
jgi:Major Facilitator Superfamily